MTAIPPVYDPGLSDEVIACAERLALEELDSYPRSREDTPHLYRVVRSRMGRRSLTPKSEPTLDDESVSEGIVRALNAYPKEDS